MLWNKGNSTLDPFVIVELHYCHVLRDLKRFNLCTTHFYWLIILCVVWCFYSLRFDYFAHNTIFWLVDLFCVVWNFRFCKFNFVSHAFQILVVMVMVFWPGPAVWNGGFSHFLAHFPLMGFLHVNRILLHGQKVDAWLRICIVQFLLDKNNFCIKFKRKFCT